jgi:hypothetical protein
MAADEERNSGFRDRVIQQRDTDKEQIDAWMKGNGAEILVVIAAILCAGFLWRMFSDSPLLALGVIATAGAYIAMKRLDLW